MFNNMPRAKMHADRVQKVLEALTEARQNYFFIGMGAAFATAGKELGESHASVQRSWKMAANQRELAIAAKMVGTRGQVKATRTGYDAEDLAKKVVEEKGANVTLRVTAVAAKTRYSPGWVGDCERNTRNGKVKPKKKKPELYLVGGLTMEMLTAAA